MMLNRSKYHFSICFPSNDSSNNPIRESGRGTSTFDHHGAFAGRGGDARQHHRTTDPLPAGKLRTSTAFAGFRGQVITTINGIAIVVKYL